MEGGKHISFRTHGTSELSRFRDAIDPEYFGIDERSLSDILSFLLKYSESVRYVNSDNKIDGDWSPFFENNLAFVIAIISSTNIDSYNTKFKRAARTIEDEIVEEEKIQHLKILVEVTFQLFTLLDQWHKLSRRDLIHLEENKLAEHLQNAIKVRLASQLKAFKKLVQDLNQQFFASDQLFFSFDSFDYVWHISEKLKAAYIDDIELFEFKKAVKDISGIYKSVFSVATYLKSIAPDLLDQVLSSYPYHSPHVSLLISFVKVFENVQKDVNNLTKRHLDFYYGKILKQSLKPSEPDQVHVYFDPADHIVKSNIPAGTLLTAGMDEEGLLYTYTTDHNVELSQAQISDIKIVHVAQNPVIGVGNTFTSVSNIYSRSVPINEQGFALDNSNNPASFDTFGKDQVDTSYVNRDMEQATVGFAISSSVLVLKEGERSISLCYKFNLSSLSALISFIEELAKKEKLSPENAFYKLLNNIFSIRYTTDDGWFQIENYEILPPKSWTTGEVTIEMMLAVSDPSMTPFNKEVHGEDYDSQWPVLEFVLSSKHSMYAYSYLKDLLVEECQINVKVENAKDLHVFNDLGKLDTTKPFYPFGSTPDLGSYFLVGNEEMFYKSVTDFSLNVLWHNLPKTKGGFTTYYKDYQNDISTESFKVGITCLSDFLFHPVDEEDIQRVSLFREDKSKKALAEELTINNIDLEKLDLRPSYTTLDLSDYTSKTRSGFLKFEIMEPESGFGHAEYPRLFANAVVENSKASAGLLSKDAKKVDLPNEPFAPQIRTISINYSASAKLVMNVNRVAENDKASGDQIYHLHPFGNKLVFDHGLPTVNALVSQFDEEGYLIIGLDNVQAPLELSLYFELEDNVRNEINYANVPDTRWRYLVHDEWVNFEQNEVIFDGTNNFTTSGNVRLKVPSNIDTNHHILPSGKYWLSVSAEFNTQILSKTIMVKNNGVIATWRPHKKDEQWKANIQANTVSGFFETRSDVNGVNQPFPSFGGRSLETDKYYYTRVSERLKHKNRAITPSDYEKLVLNHFPDIFQAKCINHFSHPQFVKKGNVKIMVVPKLEPRGEFYAPKVDYNQLTRIESYIHSLTSPYTSIEVINPVYEKVKVSFKVVLNNSAKAGESVKKLENDLSKFICPWFGKRQGEMDFGGSIERDDILSFIESLDYVRFVTKLSVIVMHYIDGKYDLTDSATNEGRTNELHSSAPWSVLIPSENHEIELISKTAYEAAKETRISTMKIGDDFVIIDEKEDELEFPYFDLDKDTYYSIEIDL